MYILGISAFYHDSAACLLKDGKIIAAIQEERITRKKHDRSFPIQAIQQCLNLGNIKVNDLSYVVFYDKPFLKFERIIETHLYYAPRGLRLFLKSIPVWIKKKLWIKALINEHLNYKGPILFAEHHQSHAASAFYPSPFKQAAFITMDGVGEWATTSYGIGRDNEVKILGEINFPHSLGLLYSAFTYYTGFKVNSGEYKMMGLAPYGEPRYKEIIYKELIDVKPDGSFKLNMEYFGFCTCLKMITSKFEKLFNLPPREPEEEIKQEYMDIARSVQEVIEEVVIKIAGYVKKETQANDLCLAGGVALNCVANGRLVLEKIFDNIWIQPAAGDAGGALGAAMLGWHDYLDKSRNHDLPKDQMQGCLLGPRYDNQTIENYLKQCQIPYRKLEDDDLFNEVVDLINQGKVIGWFQDRMEFGPRALGARSILADPRNPDMQKKLNLKIKYRESFRPFAPSVLEEYFQEWFESNIPSPYMLLVTKVRNHHCIQIPENSATLNGLQKLSVIRSEIPAVTHVDYSARLQTVHPGYSSIRYCKLIQKFNNKYKFPLLINTSFNVRGEPIVCTPRDAVNCFYNTEMDYLVLENCLIRKESINSDNTRNQPPTSVIYD